VIGLAGIMSGEFGIGEGKTSSKGLPPHVRRPLRASADLSGGYTGILSLCVLMVGPNYSKRSPESTLCSGWGSWEEPFRRVVRLVRLLLRHWLNLYASISEANEFVERDWISLSLGESCGLSPFTGGLPGSFADLLGTAHRLAFDKSIVSIFCFSLITTADINRKR
jgi:hypothetical protein